VHAVYEHNDWFFTGWTFTEFPNEPCKAFADPKWQPSNRIKWNRSMEEIANFKYKGSVPHRFASLSKQVWYALLLRQLKITAANRPLRCEASTSKKLVCTENSLVSTTEPDKKKTCVDKTISS